MCYTGQYKLIEILQEQEMTNHKKYPTYALITEDNEIIIIMPGSPEAAKQTAIFEAKQRGKAVHYFRLEGTASYIFQEREQR